MKLPFDKVYCLHLAECKERYDNIINNFERLGIKEQVEIWWTCKREISNKIADNIEDLKDSYYNKIQKSRKNVYANVFNCSLEHYTIIKQAYLRGFNSILIMEDDIQFKDKETVERVFNNLPEDYDVIKFYSSFFDYDYKETTPPEVLFSKVYKRYSASTICYALNRKGMEKVIHIYDHKFKPSDVVLDILKYDKNINFYFLKDNIICGPKGFKSQIV